MPWLLDNYGGSWANGTGGAFERGMRFTVTQANYVITQLRWYRAVVSPNPAPTALRIWDTTTSQVVVNVAVPDNGALGWQVAQVDPPFAPVVGREYRVSTNDPATHTEASSSGDYTTPPTPFTAPQPARCYVANGGYPATTTAGSKVARDVYIEDTSPPSSNPATVADVANYLGRWFDPEAAVHYPSTNELLYPRTAQKIDASLPELLDKLKDVWDLAGVLTDLEIAAAQALWKFAKQWVGGVDGETTSAVRRTNGQTAMAVLDEVKAQLNTIQAGVTTVQSLTAKLALGVADFPTGWTQLDETSFDGDLVWAMPAQVYVVNFTAWPASNGYASRAGVGWLPRIGWWSPLNGINASDRRFVEFENQHLHLNGLQMPGLLLAVKDGSAGTVQAWYRP